MNRYQIDDRPQNPRAARYAARGMGVCLPRNVSARTTLNHATGECRGLYKGFSERNSSHHPPTFTSSSLRSFSSLLHFHSTVCFQSLPTAPRAFLTKPTSRFHSQISVTSTKASHHGCLLPHHPRPRRCRLELCSVLFWASPQRPTFRDSHKLPLRRSIPLWRLPVRSLPIWGCPPDWRIRWFRW